MTLVLDKTNVREKKIFGANYLSK